MKNTLRSALAKLLLFGMLVGPCGSLLWSQQGSSQEVLVYVRPNTIDVPLDLATDIGLTSASVKSSGFLAALQRFQIQRMTRALPSFNLADTVRHTPEGQAVAMLNLARLYRITVPPAYERDSVINALKRLPDVIYAEKNGGWELCTNDPHFGKQWYLKNTGQLGGTPGADIKAEAAWQIFAGSSQVKIGFLDTGVKTDHEDLSGKASGDPPDYNWHDPNWYNSFAHGTHVAGIAAAITNNSIGIAGVDQNAQIYSRRIFDTQHPSGDNVSIYNAIVDAVNQGCAVLNNSWDGPNYSTTVRSALIYAYKMNRVAVAAMDDHNQSGPIYPAAYGQGIIAVGATDGLDYPSYYTMPGSWVNVAAPGGSGYDIFSTLAYYNPTYGGYYDYLAGTSMATPMVSGVASLLKGYKPNLYNDDIQNVIQLSADDITHPPASPGWDQYTGYGRINAGRALQFVTNYALNQWSASGGTVVEDLAWQGYFYGLPGAPDDYYIGRRYEVRRTVSFPEAMNVVGAWGRGCATVGYDWSPNNQCFTSGYCDVVPGTLTSTSVTLRTWVYHISRFDGSYYGYYPTDPSHVTFGYTVLGNIQQLAVLISGPTSLQYGQNGTYTATASGGTAPYNYAWWIQYTSGGATVSGMQVVKPDLPPPGPTWYPIGSNSPTWVHTGTANFACKCVVTDAVQSSVTSNIISVTVDGLQNSPASDSQIRIVTEGFPAREIVPYIVGNLRAMLLWEM